MLGDERSRCQVLEWSCLGLARKNQLISPIFQMGLKGVVIGIFVEEV